MGSKIGHRRKVVEGPLKMMKTTIIARSNSISTAYDRVSRHEFDF